MNSINNNNLKDQIEEISLSSFIKNNKDLLSVCSIFAALTVFSRNLLAGDAGSWLSLLFFSGFMLLWLELWSVFPNSKTSARLSFFEQVITFSGLIIIFYWVLQLRHLNSDLAVSYISIILGGGIVTLISTNMKERKTFNKLFKTHNNGKKVLRFIFGVLLIAVVFFPLFYGLQFLSKKFDLQIEDLTGKILTTK